ncbi:MAG: cytochrome c family protein [Proteobacteria bacterium]|nr:cytochrome c family protein [Desulfobacula sp.]MBU3951641.1 cytochrome c family protein [Pseudomonadota bacterium]MBU4130689.1 cytochrome c family protein [Pseudomonadota bacterium]
MLKKILITGILVMFTLGSLAAAMASEGPDGNKRKGKYTYRKVVKACFDRGAVDSETPKVSPADKKQAEWKAIFEGKEFSEFGCDQEWTALNDEDTLDIYSYFYNSAADSPTPATCK